MDDLASLSSDFSDILLPLNDDRKASVLQLLNGKEKVVDESMRKPEPFTPEEVMIMGILRILRSSSDWATAAVVIAKYRLCYLFVDCIEIRG